jgi:hypothetical protein
MAFSALSFSFVIIVPLVGNDEPNVSLIQTTWLVQLLLTPYSVPLRNRRMRNYVLEHSSLILKY